MTPLPRRWWSWLDRFTPGERVTYGAAILTVIGGFLAITAQAIATRGELVCHQISCDTALPRAWGGLTVRAGMPERVFVSGSVDDLPAPTGVSGYKASPHCSDWGGWLSSVPRLFQVNPTLYLELSAGHSRRIQIKRIETKVYSRSDLPTGDAGTGVLVQCGDASAGTLSGLVAKVDATTGKAIVAEFDRYGEVAGTDYRMPPGEIYQAGPGLLQIEVVLNAPAGYLYEGQVLIIALVNGHEETYEIGTTETPLRWISGGDSFEDVGSYGWDDKSERWTQGHSPLLATGRD